MSESVFTIFQNYYICVRVFEKCDSMSAAARAINFMSAISISPMSVSVYTTVLIHGQLSAVLEQRFRCVGHGGIRLYHQKIFSIERRVTKEQILIFRSKSFLVIFGVIN